MSGRAVIALIGAAAVGLGGFGSLVADAANPSGFAAVVNSLDQVPAVGDVLWAVSCPSSTQCVAVGSVPAWPRSRPPVVLAGDPSSWSAAQVRPIQFPKRVFGTVTPSVHSVACTSFSSCVAVGQDGNAQAFVLAGDPASWGAAEAHEITGHLFGGLSYLNAVACTSSTACVAVGGDNHGKPIVLTGNPSTWSAADAHEIALGRAYGSQGTLEAVTCTSASSCVAVGYDGHEQPLVFAGNPSKWDHTHAREVTLGQTYGSSGSLAAVTCASASSCVAVGDDAYRQPLVLAGNPSTWNVAQAREIALGPDLGSGGLLNAVTCTSTSSCFAVGRDGLGDDWPDGADWRGEPLILAGDPSTWGAGQAREIDLGSAAGRKGELRSIACATPSACVAAGFDASDPTVIDPKLQPLVLSGDPSTWGAAQAQEVTLKGVRFGVVAFSSVLTCVSASSCLELGSSVDPGSSFGGEYLLQGDPASWDHANAVPMTGIPAGAEIHGNACPTSTYCVAVGTSGPGQPLVLTGDPATWDIAKPRVIPLGRKFGGLGSLTAVACSSGASCVAVGWDNRGHPIVVTGNPETWTRADAREITLGANFPSPYLTSVACRSSTDCVAVGYVGAWNRIQRPLVLAGNPSSWGTATARQIGRLSGELNSVACLSRTYCVSVGESGGEEGHPLVVEGNPAKWTAKSAFELSVSAAEPWAVRGRSSRRADGLESVSCDKATDFCVAAGDDSGVRCSRSFSCAAPVYIAGNPSTWRGRRVARPAKDGWTFRRARLRTTSCAPTACFAGGFANGGDFVASFSGG